MRTLLLQRRGVLFEAEWVGPILELPPQPTAKSLGLRAEMQGELEVLVSDPNALPIRLGLERECVQFGRIDAIQPHGLHDATKWERLVVSWIAGRLGVADPLSEAAAEAADGPMAAMGRILADPIARWPDAPPTGLTLLHAEDPDLEALGATRWLRQLLLDVEPDAWPTWVDDVLIVVPDDAGRVANWRTRLEEAGLPVRSRGWESVAETPIGRWALALASLAGGEDRPVQRSDLHAVFDAPLYTMPGEGRRSDLRAILRELRRPTITFAMLMKHAAAWFARRTDALDAKDVSSEPERVAERLTERKDLTDRAAAIETLLSWVSEALGSADDPNIWGKLRHLLGKDRLAVQTRVGATGQPDLIAALAGFVSALDDLCRTSATTAATPAATLREALSSSGRGLRSRPTSGVRLQTWSSWDGLGAARVVLAGLEEGGFPRPPASLGAVDRALAQNLHLGDASDELARQARVLARVLGSADNAALLSWSMTDSQGSDTFPGAFLAGRPFDPKRHGARAHAWKAVTRHIAERDLAPAGLDDAWSPADARMLPKPPGVDDALWDAAEHAAFHATVVDRARAPSEPGTPVGPWTGKIGSAVPEQVWSPTSLEDLGQCATKFFLGRLLRAERDEDSGSLLDARESGSLVHASLATAALDAIAKDKVWRLQPTNGEDPATHGAARADEAARAMTDQVGVLAAQHPTLGTGITHWTARRWEKAVSGALMDEARQARGGALVGSQLRVEDLGEPELDLVSDVNKDAGKAVASLRKVRSQFEAATLLIHTLVHEGLTEEKAVNARAKELGLKTLSPFLSGTAIEDARSAIGIDGTALHGLINEKLRSAYAKVEPYLIAALEKDRTSVARDVVAAEWSFGMTMGDGPLDRRSVDEPLPIAVKDGAPLLLMGRVDRIDGDIETSRLAIVDYKAGAKKSDGRLLSSFGEGRHLQLPVYGRAATTLLTRELGWTGDAVTEVGRLQFTRTANQATLDLGGLEMVVLVEPVSDDLTPPPEDVLGADQVLEAHLSHSARRLRSGLLPLAPRACPLRSDKDAHCDFDRSCGFAVSAVALADGDAQPRFQAAAKMGKSKQKSQPELRPLAPLAPADAPPTPDSAKPAHAATLAVVKDLTRDVVVSAGAGSGKTKQLVERYIEAVKAGHSPDQILAITFTRKATAEMRTRVRARLLEGVPGLSEESVRKAVLALGSAPILTIDAFAARVVQALDADANGDLRVATGSDQFAERWIDAQMLKACDAPGDDLTRLLEKLPLSEVRAHVLAHLKTAPERVRGLAVLDANAVVARWQTALERAWPEMREGMTALERLSASLLTDPEALPEELVREIEVGRAIAAQGGVLAFLAALRGLSFLKKLPSPFLNDTWLEIRALKVRWTSDDAPTGALAKRLGDLLKLPDASADEKLVALQGAITDEAETSLAAIRVASVWRTELDEERTRRGVSGFDDVLARATSLLRSAARDHDHAKEAGALLPYAHIFVDEFQDTNRAQVALLDALTGTLTKAGQAPRLFLVGDVKQSIYRFRGAEVDVFQAQTQRTDRKMVTLDACWRARPPLTRSIDRLFGRVLAPTHAEGGWVDDLARVPWEPLAPRWTEEGPPRDEDEEVGPCVELLGSSDTSADPSAASLDDQRDEDDATPESAEDEEEQPLDADVQLVIERIKQIRLEPNNWTIAILTHSWKLAATWGEHLRNAQIPAYVQGGRGMLSDPSVAPIVAILDALEREDDLGLLEVLRGKLVGLSDTGLWAIRNRKGVTVPTFGDGSTHALPERVRFASLRHGFTFDAAAAVASLETQGTAPAAAELVDALHRDAQRIAAWAPWWTAARTSFGLDPLDRTVANIITASGYRRTLRGDGGDAARTRLAALRRFEHLLRGLAESVDGGASSVVRELRRMAEDEEDPGAASNPYVGDAVTVTVVHQSKGLAWDVVVLPALGSAKLRSRVDQLAPIRVLDEAGVPVDLPLVRTTSARDPFALERGIASTLVHAASAPWERAEQRRLLYVACTRARERVILAGGVPASFNQARDLLVKLGKRSPKDAPSHRVSRSWLEDVVIALGLEVTDPPSGSEQPGTWRLGEGAWVEGRDYRWVQPVAIPTPATIDAVGSVPSDTARRLAVVPSQPVLVRNPSKATGGGAPTSLPEVAATGADRKLDQPFGSPRLAGTIAHRAFATWAWRDIGVDTVTEAAIRDELPERVTASEVFVDALPAYTSWVAEVVRTAEARQPELARDLRAAAARGDVVHETCVQVDVDGARVEGSIDLLWRDATGMWHLLDYKVTGADEVSDESLDKRVAHYHPQVALYAQSIQGRLGHDERLATYGLWFVKEGRVVRWSAP